MMFVSMAHMMGDQDRRGRKGLLDTLGVAAATAFSLRLLTGSFKGNCCNIRRSSDNAQQNVGFDSQGNFNIGQFSSFVGGGSGFVTKWYDQSGNGFDVSQGTAATQPQISLASTPSGVPSVLFSGSQFLQVASGWVGVSQPQSLAAVAQISNITAGFVAVSRGSATNDTPQMFLSGSNTVAIQAPTQLAATASNAAFHSFIAVFSGAGSSIDVDGTITSGNTGTNFTTGTFTIASNTAGGSPLTGNICEVIGFNVGLTTTQQGSLRSSQKSYWGTP